MVGDADIHVWLDMVERVNPPVIIPYVQSDEEQSLGFRVRVVQKGRSGRSVIGQSGALRLLPGTPAELSRVSIRPQPDSQCDIEIILTRNNMKELHYRFECPT
jgi:hypothetical protein